MSIGSLTISIDLELAWGNWDNLDADHVRHIEALERPIIRRLLEIFDRHSIPVTWAFVAALLDPDAAAGRQGSEHLWYAPDVIEAITSAATKHDLGSHGGHHHYFDEMSEAEAEDELGYARSIHDRAGLSFTSFVFPRNKVARTAMLERHGLRVYRGTDRSWHQRIRNRQPMLGRAANLVDKLLPLAPETVRPVTDGEMINLPGSMLLIGRNGVRRFASPAVVAHKLRAGLDAAQRDAGCFHLWFHPSNFWHDTDRQFALLDGFVADAARRVQGRRLEIKTMAAFA